MSLSQVKLRSRHYSIALLNMSTIQSILQILENVCKTWSRDGLFHIINVPVPFYGRGMKLIQVKVRKNLTFILSYYIKGCGMVSLTDLSHGMTCQIECFITTTSNYSRLMVTKTYQVQVEVTVVTMKKWKGLVTMITHQTSIINLGL